MVNSGVRLGAGRPGTRRDLVRAFFRSGRWRCSLRSAWRRGLRRGERSQYAGWGFGLTALVAAAHCLAMLIPRYDLDALAWALTIVVGGILLVLLAPGGGA